MCDKTSGILQISNPSLKKRNLVVFQQEFLSLVNSSFQVRLTFFFFLHPRHLFGRINKRVCVSVVYIMRYISSHYRLSTGIMKVPIGN